MKISELQKLDFLLKRVNEEKDSENYRIVFGLNNQIYVGDFVPKIVNIENTNERNIEIKDVTSFESDTNRYINLTNLDNWFALSKRDNAHGVSRMNLLISTSNNSKSQDYFSLLNYTLESYEFDFDNELPHYIYNVKGLATQLPINFMKIDENTKFDFISIVPENTI